MEQWITFITAGQKVVETIDILFPSKDSAERYARSWKDKGYGFGCYRYDTEPVGGGVLDTAI